MPILLLIYFILWLLYRPHQEPQDKIGFIFVSRSWLILKVPPVKFNKNPIKLRFSIVMAKHCQALLSIDHCMQLRVATYEYSSQS